MLEILFHVNIYFQCFLKFLEESYLSKIFFTYVNYLLHELDFFAPSLKN